MKVGAGPHLTYLTSLKFWAWESPFHLAPLLPKLKGTSPKGDQGQQELALEDHP